MYEYQSRIRIVYKYIKEKASKIPNTLTLI